MIEQADVNRKKAFELRLPPHRLSYPAIARTLGVSLSTAYRYVKEEHGEIIKDIGIAKEELRHLENETVDLLIERWLPIALEPKNKEFGLRAVDRIIRLVEQKCRINGLFAEMSSDSDHGRDRVTIERELLKFVYNNVGTPQAVEKNTIDGLPPSTHKEAQPVAPPRKRLVWKQQSNSASSSTPPNLPKSFPNHSDGSDGFPPRPNALPPLRPAASSPPVPGPRRDIVILK